MHTLTIHKPDQEPKIHLVPNPGLLVQMKVGSQWVLLHIDPTNECVNIMPVNATDNDVEYYRQMGAQIDPPGLKRA